jgi:hypothetical protein
MRHAAQVLGLVGLLSIAAGVPARADVVLSGPDTNDGGIRRRSFRTSHRR